MTNEEATVVLDELGGCCSSDKEYVACHMAISALSRDRWIPCEEQTMYEELVKRLRIMSDWAGLSFFDESENVRQNLLQAADAIEELSKPRWISVEERLPEESEGLNWHEDMMIRFTSVWCCDANTGTIEIRNRLQGKIVGNEYLDKYTKDTDWHWSKSWWEPTHWMPIVPLPEPPKEET